MYSLIYYIVYVMTMTEEQKEDLFVHVHEIARMQYVNGLLERYKLSGYVRKKTDSDEKLVLEHPEKAGWYVMVCDDGCVVNVFEEGLKVLSVVDESVCKMTYWNNGKLKSKEFSDIVGNVLRKEEFSEEGELAESTCNIYEDRKKYKYVQEYKHSKERVDEQLGRLIKCTECIDSMIDGIMIKYWMYIKFEGDSFAKLYERCIGDGYFDKVYYGKHEKLGWVIEKIETDDWKIELKYSDYGWRAVKYDNKRLVNRKREVYFEYSLNDIDLLTDYEKIVKLVEKNKFEKVAVKRHWYDFKDKKYDKAVETVKRSLVELEKIDLKNIEFIEGTIV